MGNIQRAIENEIERRVRLENGHQNAGARRAMVKVKREMAEFRKELRCLKDELAEISETVSGTARPKHLAVPRVDGAGIRKLRKKNELTAKEFAAILGVSLETVSRWENGKQRIRSAHKKAIANLRNLGKKPIRKMLIEKRGSIIREQESGSSPAKSSMTQPHLQRDEEEISLTP